MFTPFQIESRVTKRNKIISKNYFLTAIIIMDYYSELFVYSKLLRSVKNVTFKYAFEYCR